ncbi:hypothetical protein V8G69_12675 [Gaetbulibacter sp. M235]|uniref:hypothetical protein n=1 Tax=Gaetbulibacter sp. M235 TaxID=3126510 RepID=UPI00374FDA16
MKRLLLFSLNKVFVGALFLLIVLNIIGAVSEDALFLQSTKPLFIPVFLIFFFINNKFNNIPFILFFLYSFLGDSSSMFFSNEIFLKASSIMYFLSYLCLLSFIIPKFKFEEFNKIIAIYLTIVLLINMFFLYVVYGVLKSIIPDSLELFLFGIKSISLIVLVIIAFGVYLNSESRQTILFLIMTLCFMFSDLLNYISQYYVYHWSFLMLDRILHILGLFYLFNFIIEYNKSYKKEEIKEDKLPANNILA